MRNEEKSPLGFVDPLIGTSYDPKIHVWGPSDYGGTVPFVTPPFSMTKFSPMTRENRIGRAVWSCDDDRIIGFTATHQPSIWMGDYGYLTVMPRLTPCGASPEERGMPFDRKNEYLSPCLCRETLEGENGETVGVTLTSTSRCGVLRSVFSAGKGYLMTEVTRAGIKGEGRIVDDRTVYVSNPHRMDSHLNERTLPHFRGYYVLRFSVPFRSVTLNGKELKPGDRFEEEHAVLLLSFDAPEAETRIGSSFIGYEQAERNLTAEVGDKSLGELSDALKEEWNALLGKLRIDADRRTKTIFYTGLYHALLFPNAFYEEDRYYSAFDDRIHEGKTYTSFSIWDTFRAENSLITLLCPERVNGMIESLLHVYEEGGYLPKWPNPSYTNIMISTHADSLIAEAMAKGFDGFDTGLAWEAVKKDGTVPPPGDRERLWRDRDPGLPYEARAGLSYLTELGYIPTDRIAEAASRTIEGCYDDWCISRVAAMTGRKEEEAYFLERSHAYRRLMDPDSGLLRGRKADGTFDSEKNGWTEGGQWNYHFFTPHDVEGMVEMLGRDRYLAELDEYFEKGYNFHPNEPSHHVPYLYAYLGETEKAAEQIGKIARENYSDEPASGLTGNEDCGQMSAWYIFSALGFYPLNPASADYVLARPLVKSAALDFGGGRVFRVVRHAEEGPARFVLNGKPLAGVTVSYAEITAGGTLEFYGCGEEI